MALVFGMAVSGCDDNSGGGTDPALNGTWVLSASGFSYELKLDNGKLEQSTNGSPLMKGTYTTSGKSISLTITDVHGSTFEGMLESKWYTIAELKASPIASSLPADFGSPQTSTYSVSGNTLALTTTVEGRTQTVTYTKKG
jgi:hypothetical protein